MIETIDIADIGAAIRTEIDAGDRCIVMVIENCWTGQLVNDRLHQRIHKAAVGDNGDILPGRGSLT